MKNFILVFLLTLPALLTKAQENKTPYETRSLSNEKIRNIEMQTSGGGLSVTASSTSEARLEVYINGNNGKSELSNEEIKKRLAERYDLSISVANNKLTAIAKQKSGIKDWNSKGLNISFKVFVPKDVSTELSTSGGSIHLTGISGDQDFTTSGGSLHVTEVSGKIKGRTSGGNIHVENSSENIDLTTSGGGIHAKNCDGTIRLNTSGGSITLNDLKGDIKATTSGGSVKGGNISGALIATTSGGSIKLNDLACDLETATSGGGIDVSIVTLGKHVKISNSGGSITLQLPKDKGMNLDVSANKIKADQLVNFTGTSDSNEIEGKMNGGGIPVNVRSSSNVSLVFK